MRRAFAAIPLTRQSRLRIKRLLFRTAGPLFRNTSAYRNWLHDGGNPTSSLDRPALLDAPAPDRRISPRSALEAASSRALPDVDISVVTYNSARWLDGFFESLLAQDYPVEKIGLLIADNASSDETAAKVRELTSQLDGRFRAIRFTARQNDGFGGGHNHNATQGEAPFLLIANVDLRFDPAALTTVVSVAARDAEDVAAWELRQKPFEHPKYYDPVSLETAWCSAACLLIRRSVFGDVGGFDDRIFMYGEDVELSYRLRDAGYSLRYVPHAVVWHYTYEHEGEVKPLQFTGTILANGYLRLRYGTTRDIVKTPIMFARAFIGRGPLPNHRGLVARQGARLLLNAPHFLFRRKRSATRFGFDGWDYELQRQGAFHPLAHLEDTGAPLVSIVVRTYRGRQRLLGEAVASVVNQTYRNIELLIVEDGSDDAAEFAQSIEREARVRTRHIAAPKLGRSHAGNLGLGAATGDYIMFLDDDDLLFADHVEVLIATLQAAPEKLAAYSLSWQVETDLGADGGKVEHVYATPQAHRRKFSKQELLRENFIPIQSVLFHRSLYDQSGGFIEELDAFEDWNLWIRYSQHTDFSFVEKTTSIYRVPADDEARSRRTEHMEGFQHAARSAGLGERARDRIAVRD